MAGNDLGTWEPLAVRELARMLAGAPFPWWVAGGWAIDLFVGRQTRRHDDLDVLVLRRDHLAVRHALREWDPHAADPPGTLRPWLPGETLGADIHDVWCRAHAAAPWAFQLMLADLDAPGTRWLFRRDHRITGPMAGLGRRSADGIPYLAPEVQLLIQSKARPAPEGRARLHSGAPPLGRPRQAVVDAGALRDAAPASLAGALGPGMKERHSTPGSLAAEMDLVIRRLLSPAYPTLTRAFTDIALVLERHAEAFRALVLGMCQPRGAEPPDVLVDIESYDYLFAAPMAFELGCQLVLARRAGKLPRATLRRKYRSSGLVTDPARTMEIHEGAIAPGSRVRIVDDVLATGGTALAAVDLVEQAGGIPVGVSVAFELERFHARQRLEERGVPVHAAMRL